MATRLRPLLSHAINKLPLEIASLNDSIRKAPLSPTAGGVGVGVVANVDVQSPTTRDAAVALRLKEGQPVVIDVYNDTELPGQLQRPMRSSR